MFGSAPSIVFCVCIQKCNVQCLQRHMSAEYPQWLDDKDCGSLLVTNPGRVLCNVRNGPQELGSREEGTCVSYRHLSQLKTEKKLVKI